MALDFGSVIGGAASAYGSYRAAKQAAEMQINWERERAKNAHQWEVEDLKKAGLNPILSAGGQGALTGSINPATPDYSALENITSHSAAVSQAKTAKKAMEKENELKEEQKEATKAQANLYKTQETNTALENQRLEAENEANIPLLQLEGNYRKSKIGKGLTYMGMGLKDAAPILNLFGLGLGGFAIKRALGKATTAIRASNTIKGGKMIQNTLPPKGHLRPMTDNDRFRFEHIPAIYRNGHRSH